MQKKLFKANEIIHNAGDALEEIILILEGSAHALFPGGELHLKKGDTIGISALYMDSYIMTFHADTQLIGIAYNTKENEITRLLVKEPEAKSFIIASAFRQLEELFNIYKKQKADCLKLYHFYVKNYAIYTTMCESHRISPRVLPGQEEIVALDMVDDVEPWLCGYYQAQGELILRAEVPAATSTDFYRGMGIALSSTASKLLSGIAYMHEYQQQILNFFMNEDRIDLFDLFSMAYLRIYNLADGDKPDAGLITDTLRLLKSFGMAETPLYVKRVNEYQERIKNSDQQQLSEDDEDAAVEASALAGSLNVILDYSGCADEVLATFKIELKKYKETVNKSSTEDEDRKRRLVISKHFYEIYSAAVLRSLDDEQIPRIVKMFLHFGFMDEGLAGMKNAAYLYNIVEHLPTDPDKGVYTFYEWLRAIYAGKKIPSRNEFDTDYGDYVAELRRNSKITKQQEAEMLADTRSMVVFELENAFPVINKVTNGRPTTFCPVFSEHNVFKTLKQMLASADMVKQCMDEIRAIDFGAFCRETVFSYMEIGIVKEMISLEILPDVILAPNVGTRGIMWQEIEGKRRSTPSRFMLSLFQADDLRKILYRLVGDFRWEMCKRIQGARWNDASERSLTSDYSDYIASYRKNNDISSDIKEKIKSDLTKFRNNTKEMFIFDYISWLQYESNGSPRLNKVARAIMITYCPFSKKIRDKLKVNPFYTEALEKYDIRLKNRLRHFDNLGKSLANKGFELPEEIQETRRLMNS